jgi:ABC-type polysaccharide/polyol phosphate transport system ATPase subunit
LHGSVKVSKLEALKSISFTLDSGEILGVVGGNGAGKSTLLKVLARVLPPSSGQVSINGSLAPMISLGAGFHPELTGNENTIFYSALIGRDIKTVKNELEAIGEWAGVLGHMDFPVRSFSSGMIARLAFSCATHERADILLVDEVLSVGDESFRSATKSRILDHISQGSGVVIVSHESNMIRELCTKVLWIEKGAQKMYGETNKVMDAYQNKKVPKNKIVC